MLPAWTPRSSSVCAASKPRSSSICAASKPLRCHLSEIIKEAELRHEFTPVRSVRSIGTARAARQRLRDAAITAVQPSAPDQPRRHWCWAAVLQLALAVLRRHLRRSALHASVQLERMRRQSPNRTPMVVGPPHWLTKTHSQPRVEASRRIHRASEADLHVEFASALVPATEFLSHTRVVWPKQIRDAARALRESEEGRRLETREVPPCCHEWGRSLIVATTPWRKERHEHTHTQNGALCEVLVDERDASERALHSREPHVTECVLRLWFSLRVPHHEPHHTSINKPSAPRHMSSCPLLTVIPVRILCR